jgi:hypothetical protein
MARKQDAPKARPVTAEDVDPRHRWDRPLQAPGIRRWISRSGSTSGGCTLSSGPRASAGAVEPRAILVFDQYNIRYLSGTVIGEWARDKLTLVPADGQRRALGLGFRLGSATSPALHAADTRPPVVAGMVGMRGAIAANPEGGRRD